MRAQTEGGRLGGDAGRLGAALRISFLHSRPIALLHLSRSARNATSYCILQPGPGLSKNRVSTQPARHRLPHPPAEPARRTRLPRSAKPLTKARPVSPTAKTRGTSGSNLASSSGESVSLPKPLSYVENPDFPCGCARLAWRLGRQRRARCFDIAMQLPPASLRSAVVPATPIAILDPDHVSMAPSPW